MDESQTDDVFDTPSLYDVPCAFVFSLQLRAVYDVASIGDWAAGAANISPYAEFCLDDENALNGFVATRSQVDLCSDVLGILLLCRTDGSQGTLAVSRHPTSSAPADAPKFELARTHVEKAPFNRTSYHARFCMLHLSCG